MRKLMLAVTVLISGSLTAHAAPPRRAATPTRSYYTTPTKPSVYGSYYQTPRGTGTYNGTGVQSYRGGFQTMPGGRTSTYSGGYHPYFQGYYGRYSPTYTRPK